MDGVNLSGASFKKSNLSFTSFAFSTLIDCDFSEANLSWTSFVHANLKNSNMRKAKLNFAKLNNANFEGVDLSHANLSWCLAFHTDLGPAKIDNVKGLQTVAWHPSQLKEEGHRIVSRALEESKSSIPPKLFGRIKTDSKKLIEQS